MGFLKFLLRLYQVPLLWLSKQCFCLADRVEKWAAKDGMYVPKGKRIQSQAIQSNNLAPTVDAEVSRSLRHIEDMEKTKKYWRSALGWGLLAWWGLSK